MARLIDADLAIAKIQDDGILGSGYSDIERVDDVCDMIDSCPTVDAVEVVRCKDCKYYDKGECIRLSEPPEIRAYERWTVDVDENDFCSYGERRTDD